ncbi:IS21 family transposase, partial [Pseudomonas aeruginosa]
AGEIGEHARRLCQLLFAIEGRVGQRKLWGIVSLARRYPAHCVNTACAQALEQGIYSYKRVLALTEAIFAQALAAIETESNSASSG